MISEPIKCFKIAFKQHIYSNVSTSSRQSKKEISKQEKALILVKRQLGRLGNSIVRTGCGKFYVKYLFN